MKNIHRIDGNIYITNDEEIKEDDWVVEITTSPRAPYIGKTFYPKNDGTVTEEVLKKYLLSVNYKDHYETIADKGNCSKIILTDNPDLIKDGVQAIDDEFLEWFVKNPSCEFVEVERETIIEYEPIGHAGGVYKYKIIIPKDEPKQETLEEVAKKYSESKSLNKTSHMIGFIAGAKWQQQQNKNLYSEVIDLLERSSSIYYEGCDLDINYESEKSKIINQLKQSI